MDLGRDGGRRDALEVYPDLWAGAGLVRGGAGTALVGDPDTVAMRMQECADVGVDTFVLSGYPHLEEAYRVAELLFPRLPVSTPTRTAFITGRYPQRTSVGLYEPLPFPEGLGEAALKAGLEPPCYPLASGTTSSSALKFER